MQTVLPLIATVEQQVFGVEIKDCEPLVHCTPTPHTNALAAGDELAAAFESRAAHFELCDGVRFVVARPTRRRADDQRATGGRCGFFSRMRASSSSRSPRSRRTDTSVVVGHRHECVAAARRAKPPVLFGHVDAAEARNANRAALHSEQLH